MSKCVRCGKDNNVIFKEERIDEGTVKTIQCMTPGCGFVWREFQDI